MAVITPSASREICISRGAPPYTQADSMPRGRPVAIADAISRNQSPSDAISRHQSRTKAAALGLDLERELTGRRHDERREHR